MKTQFVNRREAGEELATKLTAYANRPDVLVLALPRGGVPVGFAVAQALHVPFDVFLVRKLGVPGHEELAMGAVASGGVRVLNPDVVEMLRIPASLIDTVADRELQEIERREQQYRARRPAVEVQGRTLILVDDGLATGATMRAAVTALRQRRPARVIVAVPTAASETCADLRTEVEEIVCAHTPEPFYAVGLWYDDFTQVGDEEVRDLLTAAVRGHGNSASAPTQPATRVV